MRTVATGEREERPGACRSEGERDVGEHGTAPVRESGRLAIDRAGPGYRRSRERDGREHDEGSAEKSPGLHVRLLSHPIRPRFVASTEVGYYAPCVHAITGHE